MRPRCCDGWLRGRAAAALLLLASLLSGCAPLTVAEEAQLGSELAQQTRRQLLFIRDAVVVDYVRDIGQKLVAAAGPQPFEYHFEVVEDDDINAFAAPAGYIYIHTATILRARHVNELAAVLAHEVGHVSLRHVARNYERQRGASTLHQAGVLAASVFGYGGLANLGGGLAAIAVLNSFTRSDEAAADEFAVGVMTRAGYDPDGLTRFLEVVAEEEQAGRPPAFLSSHPDTRDRIADVAALVEASPRPPGLRKTDRGRLEIIQRRIEILTRKVRPSGPTPL